MQKGLYIKYNLKKLPGGMVRMTEISPGSDQISLHLNNLNQQL